MKEDPILDRCRWPELPERYVRALRAAVAFALRRFDVLGVIACGTIVRGVPDPSSDLDLYVLHRDGFRQRIQRFFHDVPTEIFVNSPRSVERYLEEERARRRPVTAHMLATGFVVLDLDPVVEVLRGRATEEMRNPPEPTQQELISARYTAEVLLGNAVQEMVRFCFVQAGNYLPRTKDLFDELARLDAGIASLARRFFAGSDFTSRLDLAARIADRTIQARGFFEWESERAEVR
jgi:predicted nucleotidyltransferase